MNVCEYSPQISPGNSFYTPPPETQPAITPRDSIVLTYPLVSPTHTIELRNPQLNDKRVKYLSRIDRKTRNGSLDIARVSYWPKAVTLNLAIFGLSDALAEDYIDFVNLTLGKEVGLLDYNSLQWKGILINPGAKITQETRLCGRTIKVDFQGELA